MGYNSYMFFELSHKFDCLIYHITYNNIGIKLKIIRTVKKF